MHDLKNIRENAENFAQGLKDKNNDFDLQAFLALDEQRREHLHKVEQEKSRLNSVSKQIGQMKREGQDASQVMAEMKELSELCKSLDDKAKTLDSEVMQQALWIPNLAHSSVPVGHDESANKEVSQWGEKPDFAFKPMAHWDLGEKLGILDFARAAKISGSGFVLYRGLGARLERALISFMLDEHRENHGYEEVFPPFVVNSQTMTGTGQLPKMAEDMYKTAQDDLYLIPTAEVPVTNIYRDETLSVDDLPKCMVAYTPCFRREAGAHGKDTRGMIRVHQFDKVELVRLVEPESSYQQLELLRGHAETILQKLGLPYRVLELCSGDLSFAAAKCYDIEVWAPGQGSYLEVSSCSNFEDFQSRRLALRYKPSGGGKSQLVHTLNGSGLALPRTVIAILENYQQEDGSVEVPEVLRPYLGCDRLSVD